MSRVICFVKGGGDVWSSPSEWDECLERCSVVVDVWRDFMDIVIDQEGMRSSMMMLRSFTRLKENDIEIASLYLHGKEMQRLYRWKNALKNHIDLREQLKSDYRKRCRLQIRSHCREMLHLHR